jgi:hypothetical protein
MDDRYVPLAYNAMQKKELEEHKWFLSERAGQDIGWEETFHSWISEVADPKNYPGETYAARFQRLYHEHIHEINNVCDNLCKKIEDCRGIYKCPLENGLVHKLMHDKDPRKK